MWHWLASFLAGPVISGAIAAYKARLDAANSQDRIAAELAAKEIEAEIEARKQSATIVLAEQGRCSGRCLRHRSSFISGRWLSGTRCLGWVPPIPSPE